MEQTFEITIISNKNHTIQGTITLAGGVAVPFRSELELLREIDRRLPPGLAPERPDTGCAWGPRFMGKGGDRCG